jgi:hypothetical protein
MSSKTDKNVKPLSANAVHFTLQGKGGVGKSLVSAFLAQYFRSLDSTIVKCIDTDPVNQTLVSYKALDASYIKLMEGSKIDERNFDNLMERLLSEDGIFIVDNGSSSFVPLSNYLIENNAIQMLLDSGRQVYIHCVVTGGQALIDTLVGFKSLAQQTKSTNIIVWLNEYFGPIEQDGKSFNEMRVYHENAEKIRGIVRIAKRNQDTFGRDVQTMASGKLIFDEVLNGSDFTIMAKQRIRTIQRDIYEQLGAVGF